MNDKTPDALRDDASPVETEHNAYGAPSGMGLSREGRRPCARGAGSSRHPAGRGPARRRGIRRRVGGRAPGTCIVGIGASGAITDDGFRGLFAPCIVPRAHGACEDARAADGGLTARGIY